MTRPFLRRYLQMLAAMVGGMVVFEPVRMVAADALGWSVFFARTEPLALAMATEMSLGVVAWMRYRGHRWRVTLEMCLAMFVPGCCRGHGRVRNRPGGELRNAVP